MHENILIVSLITAGILFLSLISILFSTNNQKVILKTYHELPGLVRNKATQMDWYMRMEQWLNQNGATYHFGRKMTVIPFLCLCICLGVVGLILGGMADWKIGIIGLFVLGLFPVWMVPTLNKRDNENMLPELKLVYLSMEIQIAAGVYITDALSECYGSVESPRLKNALLDLASDIVMKADVFHSLERFNAKFDNHYIDALCACILQALESGQAMELLGDISEQIKDMEKSVLEKRRASLDRKITFAQLGILTVVLGIAIYRCVTFMFQSVTF